RVASPLSPSDPDSLPGARSVAAPDGPGWKEGKGYIWDAALRRGLTVRNYGFHGNSLSPLAPMVREPFAQNVRVFSPSNASLMPFSDPYYRSFDAAFPDYWRYREWKREFDGFSMSKIAPNLMLVMLPTDHLGKFDRAIDGVDTPETQIAS